MDHDGLPTCPFCNYVNADSYFLTLHVETAHPEGEKSPFAVRDLPDVSGKRHSPLSEEEITTDTLSREKCEDGYVQCPLPSCGEQIHRAELSTHTDFHVAEDMALEEIEASSVVFNNGHDNEGISSPFSTNIPSPLRNVDQLDRSSISSRESRSARRSLKDFLLRDPRSPRRTSDALVYTQLVATSKTKRLGKAELGPFAHEKQMPAWLRRLLEDGAKITISNKIGHDGSIVRVETVANEKPGLIHILARLSEADPSVERAFYCDPAVHYVSKIPREGGFCGYRNIQMMVSYIRETRAKGHKHFDARNPSVVQIQELIERAWDKGFNSNGRIETGGILGTRKYIGTPEAEALFQSLSIPCEANAFTQTRSAYGHETLLLAVGDYFGQDEACASSREKVSVTKMPPIYFQHQGHSMTIVGIELRKSDTINLVVFDPMFRPATAIEKLSLNRTLRPSGVAKLMKPYRRGEAYLARYKAFEILKLYSLAT